MKAFLISLNLLLTAALLAVTFGPSKQLDLGEVLAQMAAGRTIRPLEHPFVQVNREQGGQTSPNIKESVPFALPRFNIYQTVMFRNDDYQVPAQMDINGDGLQDFVFSRVEGYQVHPEQYVLLNNGSGFDLAYYCYHNTQSGIYRGDCADI